MPPAAEYDEIQRFDDTNLEEDDEFRQGYYSKYFLSPADTSNFRKTSEGVGELGPVQEMRRWLREGVTVATSGPLGFGKGHHGAMETGLWASPTYLAPQSYPNPSWPLRSWPGRPSNQ